MGDIWQNLGSTPSLIQPPRLRPKNLTPATSSGHTGMKPERVSGPSRSRSSRCHSSAGPRHFRGVTLTVAAICAAADSTGNRAQVGRSIAGAR